MKADHPTPDTLPGLRALWKEAFGDPDDFLDVFLHSAFAPERCLCIGARAALYWFDCSLVGQKIAYIYAVATARANRGQGLCRKLMADTHALLRSRGYAAAVLVPGSAGLREMYRSMGYRDATSVSEFTCHAGGLPTPLREVTAQTYAALRRQLLPAGSVWQEGENLRFLAATHRLYAGETCLLAAACEGDTATVSELLGDPSAAPGILKTLGCSRGNFRTPGSETPFAMVCPLVPDAPLPAYFGLAFD